MAPPSVDPPAGLRLPPDAEPAEAAAIAAAVEALLAEEARAAVDGAAADDPWQGRRYAFAGRLAKVNAAPGRVPDGAPADPWSAAGRSGRF